MFRQDPGHVVIMNGAKRIANNTAMITISSIIAVVLGFFLTVALARYLGPGSYGIFAFALAFVALFRVFFDFGLNTVVTREVARYRDQTACFFTNSIFMEAILSIGFILVIWMVLQYFGYPAATSVVVLLLATGTAVMVIGELSLAVFTAYEMRVYEAVTKIIGDLFYLILGFVGIYLQMPLIQIVMLLVVSFLIKTLMGYLLMVRVIGSSWGELDPKRWRPMLRLAMPFALAGLFFTLYFNIDMTMLSYMKGDEQVGFYAVAYRFITMLVVFPQAFLSTILPVFARLHVESKDTLVYAHEKSVRYLLMIAVPISFGTTLIAGQLVTGLFGEAYVESVIALQILIWAGALIFITLCGATTLGSIDKQHLCASSLMICVFVNIGLNMILIPQYSYIGAATATVITEVVLFSLYYSHLGNNGLRVGYLNLLARPLLASVVMAAVIYVLSLALFGWQALLQILIIIPVGTVVYGGCLILLGAFGEEDIQILRSVLERHPS